MVVGSQPAVAKECSRAMGFRPRDSAFSRLMRTTNAAASLVWEELPAVTVPFSRKQGFSLPRDSVVLSGRMPWSTVAMRGLPSASWPWTGTIDLAR